MATVGSERRPARVLVVVDQPALAEVVRLALVHGHFTMRTAHAWEEVARLINDWQPHLAVLDIDYAGGTIHCPRATASRPSAAPNFSKIRQNPRVVVTP